jgi:hypothetical protein
MLTDMGYGGTCLFNGGGAMRPTYQLSTNLYIYEIFSKQELRWVVHTVLAVDKEIADMLTWRTHRSQYRLVKTVLGGDRRKRKQPLAQYMHVRQLVK